MIAQHVVRVDRTGDELLAGLDGCAVADQQPRPPGDRVLALLGAVVRDDDDAPVKPFVPSDSSIRTRPDGLGDRGDALGDARLEQLGRHAAGRA